MMRNIINKYHMASEEVKAAMWYTISNIGQKIAPWLIMVILTHMVSTREYGIYSIFMSWTEIIEIIVTLRIYSNGYVAGLVQNNSNRDIYSITMQKLSFALVTIWLLLYAVFHESICNFTGIENKLMFLMIFSFYGTTAFGLWSSRQRVDNKYKSMFWATVLYGIIGPVIGALTVFKRSNNPIFYVICVRVFIQFAVSIPFFFYNIKGKFKIFSRRFAKEALGYNIPLVPYYLSMVLLNTAGRLMIQRIEGYEEAAIYSVAYSISMMIFVISGALNLSLQPWLFKGLKRRESQNKSMLITSGTIAISIFCLLVIAVAPEVIWIMGGKQYIGAIWVMPPVVINIIVMFIYQQYVNVLFFYKKTGLILITSIISATLNISLNAIFIPIYGYYAAGYASLVSYLFVMVLYYFLMSRTCSQNGINKSAFFDTKAQLMILVCVGIITAFMMAIYSKLILRYCLVLAIAIVLWIKRMWIKNLLQGVKK